MASRFIPNQGTNPMQMMQQYQKFKQDYIAQNGANADPKAAVMQILSQNGMDANTFINQGTQMYNQMGMK